MAADRGGGGGGGGAAKKEEYHLKKIHSDSGNVSREHVQGLMSQVLKSALFNPGGALDATSMDTA